MAVPFPFIEELKGVKTLRGFNDVLKVLSTVYTTVPWTVKPYEKEIQYKDIEFLYKQLKELKIGGWCGLNAEFFKWIIEGYRRYDLSIRYSSYNYGLSSPFTSVKGPPFYSGFTHVGVLVEIDRMEYFFDPYFARYYAHKDGYPLQFKDLIYFISERKFDCYESKFLPVKKPAIREDGTIEYISPQQFLKEILDFFNQQNLPKYLKEVFGTDNPDSLMLIKLPG